MDPQTTNIEIPLPPLEKDDRGHTLMTKKNLNTICKRGNKPLIRNKKLKKKLTTNKFFKKLTKNL